MEKKKNPLLNEIQSLFGQWPKYLSLALTTYWPLSPPDNLPSRTPIHLLYVLRTIFLRTLLHNPFPWPILPLTTLEVLTCIFKVACPDSFGVIKIHLLNSNGTNDSCLWGRAWNKPPRIQQRRVVGVVARNKIIGVEPWQMTTNSCTGKSAVLRGKDKRRVPSGKTVTTIISFSFCVPSETPVLFFLQIRLEKSDKCTCTVL